MLLSVGDKVLGTQSATSRPDGGGGIGVLTLQMDVYIFKTYSSVICNSDSSDN